MAGLIAGHDATLTAPYATAPASAYRGMAPDARIVSLKVATADGGADVTPGDRGDRLGRPARARPRPEHPRAQPLLRHELDAELRASIRSRTPSSRPGRRASSSSRRPATPATSAATGARPRRPGLQPVRDRRRRLRLRWGPRTTGDDKVGDYSASSAGCGAACKNPDFVAVGLAPPGPARPELLHRREPLRRAGSATATSAARAPRRRRRSPRRDRAVLQKYPNLTPDQVKRFITGHREEARRRRHAGAGRRRDRASTGCATKTPPAYTQKFTARTGHRLARERPRHRPLTDDGVVLTGEQDIFGKPFDAAAMATAEAAGNTWSGGTWNGNTWSGNDLERQHLVAATPGAATAGAATAGPATPGPATAGPATAGPATPGAATLADSWSGNSWSGNSWSGGTWLGATWD